MSLEVYLVTIGQQHFRNFVIEIVQLLLSYTII